MTTTIMAHLVNMDKNLLNLSEGMKSPIPTLHYNHLSLNKNENLVCLVHGYIHHRVHHL